MGRREMIKYLGNNSLFEVLLGSLEVGLDLGSQFVVLGQPGLLLGSETGLLGGLVLAWDDGLGSLLEESVSSLLDLLDVLGGEVVVVLGLLGGGGGIGLLGVLGGELSTQLNILLNHLSDGTDEVEGVLVKVVVLAIEDSLESLEGVLQVDELTLHVGENLSDLERLGQETLDLTGTVHSELVILRQLIHTQDSNNILKILVGLQDSLDVTGNIVVITSDNLGGKHTGGGIEGIHGGVDTELSHLTGQHSGGIQMCKSGGRGGISQIISRHVDSLHGGNGSLVGGGNTLLHSTHISGQGRLVTHSGGNTSQKSRHLRTGLSETENVIDEKQHILVLDITEILGHSQTSQGNTGTSTWGLVHLTVHKGGLGVSVELDHLGLNHFVVKIVTLSGTLTDTSEHGETTMLLGDVVNELHNEHSLSDTSTTEETNLSSLGVGTQQVDDLNTSHENIIAGTEVNVCGGGSVDGGTDLKYNMLITTQEIHCLMCVWTDYVPRKFKFALITYISLDLTTSINGVTEHVHNATQGSISDGDTDRGSGGNANLSSDETLSHIHSNATDNTITKMLGNLEHQTHL